MELKQPVDCDALQGVMTSSFYAMRWGMVGVATGLPLVLLVGGRMTAPHHAQPISISGYYHTAMRNVFVGTLVAIGLMLMLYKAFDKIENWLLNTAGVAAVGVALFAPDPDQGSTDGAVHGYWQHGLCAYVLFGIMGVVAIVFATDTVGELPTDLLRRRFKIIYRLLGVGMIVAPTLTQIGRAAGWGSTFWVETVGIYVFAGYWITKTVEYRKTEAETKAVRGRLQPRPLKRSAPAPALVD